MERLPCTRRGFCGLMLSRALAHRYAFTVVANITVYGAAWLLLHLQGSAHGAQDISVGDQLGVQDVPVFRVSWGCVVALGSPSLWKP